ncbi:type II secretion system protein GspG [Pseudoalteromonas luteoviolacea]|uniref:type II secretion system protein GspG n=1 Tax=Pseudoalteromonas luteoviolacea TaxID=43657 RepID=UPI001B39C91E|nr:type II secretion system protein GspG [Pseudoalteromonas luteoviolacea]MBQ4838482.1 type II secretion system protein GspG [Pseudoalteromonas luteoviolacea]
MKVLLIGFFIFIFWFLFSIIYSGRCAHHTSAVYKTSLDITILSEAVKLYRLENNSLPKSLQDLAPKYASEIPIDVWDQDYIYESTSDDYKISSLGSDAVKGGIGASTDIHSDMTEEELEKIVESIDRPIWGCND